jgi:hypothetical protein
VTTRPVPLTRNVSSKTGTKKISPIPGRRITLEKLSTRRLPGRSGMMSVVGPTRCHTGQSWRPRLDNGQRKQRNVALWG